MNQLRGAMSKKTILITGSEGLLGSELVKELSKKNLIISIDWKRKKSKKSLNTFFL